MSAAGCHCIDLNGIPVSLQLRTLIHGKHYCVRHAITNHKLLLERHKSNICTSLYLYFHFSCLQLDKNKATQPIKTALNTIPSPSVSTPPSQKTLKEGENVKNDRKKTMLKVSLIDRTAQPTRPSRNRQVKGKYPFTSC